MKTAAVHLLASVCALHAICCSSKTDPAAPPPVWQSFYAPCVATAVDVNGGKTYAGTERDGSRFCGRGSWTQWLRYNSGIASNEIRSVALDQGGKCWVATDKGISIFDGTSFAAPITAASSGGGLPSDDVRCLFLDSSGGMWAGTAAGAARHHGGAWVSLIDQTDGLAANLVISIGPEKSGP